ncbi:hypothetical protein CKO_02766 [Citrobacter koseri ATCC BAA-895]|uniref:Uncharacterized protein n=1 Tax=Citrobacter koseri (strain ATCC BAA-895 / CDC 4225-83 / SGSC4696) TaxID=290338 RepID=A8AK58_CITK8|nr:hypothetical protein CKO_02766 [Citrobacter koseri ATCC BAA-895]
MIPRRMALTLIRPTGNRRPGQAKSPPGSIKQYPPPDSSPNKH